MELSQLLIVPYGIETVCEGHFFYAFALLIVPYGIETAWNAVGATLEPLLIVPYGIETVMTYCLMPKRRNF